MKTKAINNKGKGRIFDNEFAESFSRTHPAVIYSIYLPLIAAMLYYAHIHYHIEVWPHEVLLFAAGVLSWSLFEYLMHRYLFHMPASSPAAKRLVFIMHGIHHDYPRDKTRLFMPLVPSVAIASVIFILMRLSMGAGSFVFFPGFLAGYLAYASMHYAIHTFAPPRLLKALWRNHALHHYQEPDKGFGVSSVLWDVIFGTAPARGRSSGNKHEH